MNLTIGSRGSQLALWQANHIAALLRQQGHQVSIRILKTTGDRLQEVTFAQVGSKGMFTKEIEEALANGEVDLAVHSLKDLPTDLPAGFTLAATPRRADARDAFLSTRFAALADLPTRAVVGTSSQRRRSQLKALRPDITAVEFRGNVDTRLKKLAAGQVDAILLASAGLDRLELDGQIRQRFEPHEICPAAGQGSLGIEARLGDAATLAALAFLDDPATRYAITVERAALAALGGGCQVPIGIHCRPAQFANSASSADSANLANSANAASNADSAAFEAFGVVAAPESGQSIRVQLSAPSTTDPLEFGRKIAEQLLADGAADLLRSAETGEDSAVL